MSAFGRSGIRCCSCIVCSPEGPIAATASRSADWPGCPSRVIGRAREVLRLLEGEQLVPALQQRGSGGRAPAAAPPAQLGLFAAVDASSRAAATHAGREHADAARSADTPARPVTPGETTHDATLCGGSTGQTCLARVEATGHLLTWDQFQPFNLGVPVR